MPFEVMIKQWKRRVEDSGVLDTLREREHYEPPSVKKRKKRAAAVKREYKRRMEQSTFNPVSSV
jgi:small subunit ribosomal protein S21